MKILTSDQIRQADQFTIDHEPIASIDLMERASQAFVEWFGTKFSKDSSALVVCGTGNNGGDGLAISRLLSNKGHAVEVFLDGNPEKGSPDYLINLARLKDERIVFHTEFPIENHYDVIIDGLFGSGLTRPVTGGYADTIAQINNHSGLTLAIDISSGLFSEMPVDEGAIVEADYTVSFQVPKLAFMMPGNGRFVGAWKVQNIGLDQSFIDSLYSSNYLLEWEDVAPIIRKRPKFFIKGDAGRALIVSGSLGKMGAAVLCSRACLRAGAGLLEVLAPSAGTIVLQSTVPEAMVIQDEEPDIISTVPDIEKYDVVGIGPGIGTGKKTVQFLSRMLNQIDDPVVLDADALNIISENQELLDVIPKGSIITPHPGEFRRLIGDWQHDYQRLEMQRTLAVKRKIVVVLKNAHTSIALPDGRIFFNSTGNPGMATAGSGDVLTGVLTGLLSQKYSPEETALLGVFIHGLAGDIARNDVGEESLIAGDIISRIGLALNKVKGWRKTKQS